jgi:phosphoribosylaminoimidazole-succinocarboxamide synthase
METLLFTELSGIPVRRGKVRDVYDLGDSVLLVASDRLSAFDVVLANGVPDKGRVLNQMSAFWFQELESICPNHAISFEDEEIFNRTGIRQKALNGRMTLARKAQPLAIECVARAYITGSLLKEYRIHGPNVHGLDLPTGLVESSKLPALIFTPATKAEAGHDENISFDQACDIVGREIACQARDWTLSLFERAFQGAGSAGLILADTKFEFGLTEDGLVWIDEALTPDSSRYWETSDYQEGKAQASFDKQFVRDYLEQIGWNKLPPGPVLPEEVIRKTRSKYLEAYRRITGRELLAG